MAENLSDHEDDQDIAETHPKLLALMSGTGGCSWGLGPIRPEGDLTPYVSGSPDLPPEDKVTHEVREMLIWCEHHDRVCWMIRTTQGRIIAVMQQRHEADQSRVGGEIELINAPFRDTALKGLREDVMVLTALWQAARMVSGL